MRYGYPFTAVVGMDDLRLALILSAVSPATGGVLVRGEKGTAKSTMVRALADLLPPVDVVAGCRFSCAPKDPDPECPDGPHSDADDVLNRPARLVELPVGASEDRVLGSIQLERALSEGVTAYEPGLLAGAHRGILYVDEVNLLHDHLVDVLLDAAAMGQVKVEREHVSVSHAARFVLVGTMNPEEGELRPQLLDRFGLTVEVTASRDPELRAEVVQARLAYESDPASFAARYAEAEQELSRRIAAARERLGDVMLTEAALRQITEVCAAFEVDGLRADLVTAQTAIAHAAWAGRTVVETEDVRAAARLALPHRRRRNPFDAPGIDDEQLDEVLRDSGPDPGPDDPDPDGSGPDDPGGDDPGPGGSGNGDPPPEGGPEGAQPESEPDSQPGPGTGGDTTDDGPDRQHDSIGNQRTASSSSTPAGNGTVQEAGTPFRARLLTVAGQGAGAAGRRSRAITTSGRTIGARGPGNGDDGGSSSPHLVATLIAAAPHQPYRRASADDALRFPSPGTAGSSPAVHLRREDLRLAVREGREGNLVLFCVDASGSMGARQRMRDVKTAILSLLLDAYQRRDKVGLVTFRGQEASLALPPTSSVEAAAARLESLPTGGRTPLAEGLGEAARVVALEAVRDPRRRPLLVIVTDGRATSGTDALPRSRVAGTKLARELQRVRGTSVVVDCETGPIRLGLASSLATHVGAEHLVLEGIDAGNAASTLTSTVHAHSTHRRAA
ncbi:VWA domain-containing protein [Actinobacteria bacterium YIM 96077]|uniref:Mg-protoporphyrin IX chelatase n=1 Tax=Phytoactinopolyspora halophila TaxID=1981511 RepID=A0A329QPK3_9ACTN|nr:magnesium chelatase subunit D family protein [Phytoactinopolyspora halophila]AYY15062.1 VWA domain-containing protein [Actinobacteria bacterium YIM 96077]RAW14173.1 magnesium chelatase [Phytoactinopolyspora halophila]